jgi:hypothetical protein
MSASYGLVLRGDGKGNFTPLDGTRSGFVAPGQTRHIQRIIGARRGALYVVARNNDRPLVFQAVPRVVTTRDTALARRGASASSSR